MNEDENQIGNQNHPGLGFDPSPKSLIKNYPNKGILHVGTKSVTKRSVELEYENFIAIYNPIG